MLPDSVWDTREISDAAVSRHFGRLLRAYRTVTVPGLRQVELAGWLGITQGQLSRIECTGASPRDLDKLDRWARALHIPQRLLWFELSDEHGRPTTSTASSSRGQGIVDVIIRFDEPAITHQSPCPASDLELRCQAAESYHRAAWAAYWGGQAALGHRHLTMACQLGHDAGDDVLVVQTMTSLSHHTVFYGRPAGAVAMARTAARLAARAHLPLFNADATAIWAQGLAMQGAHHDCRLVLHRAMRMLDEFGDTRSSSYLLATIARCWQILGHHANAERFARRAVAANSGSDLGNLFYNAVLSVALLAQGKVSEAAEAAVRAARTEGVVFPARAMACLVELVREFSPYQKEPEVRCFQHELARIGLIHHTERHAH